jgi:PAS domain-containing protein
MQCQERDEFRLQYSRAIFDGIPLPAFIMDQNVVIQDFNTAAELFLGPEPTWALCRRGGEALHCIHSEVNGCGRAEPCEDCVIRRSVASAIAGRNTWRESYKARLRNGERSASVQVRVTASLLPYTEEPRVLVVLEIVTPEKVARPFEVPPMGRHH